jgi:uncharacterized membrane protein YdbT with pleckstrin-like domain
MVVGLEAKAPISGKGQAQSQTAAHIPFNLYSDERLITMVKPHRTKFILKKVAPFYIILMLMALPLAIPSVFQPVPQITMYIGMRIILAFALITLLATALVVLIMYPRLTFWITDRRIINRSGIVSYSIRSIPIDVITDIVLHRGPVDLILGTNDILMPTINDDIYHLYRHRSGINHISSVDTAHARWIQKTIFTIRGKRMAERAVVSQTVSP